MPPIKTWVGKGEGGLIEETHDLPAVWPLETGYHPAVNAPRVLDDDDYPNGSKLHGM